ncbi:MAG: hypothetical protein KDA99_28335, partial [Planctomycetales bacterium]|nr:hypothetical protein [Planctomycetales bacterium]
IGRRVGHLARAFGMRLLIHSRRPPEDLPDGARAVSLAELFQTSDAVSLHCPLTEATRRLVGMDLFSRMKSSAILINTARGAIIDEDALVQALRDGRPRYAALDVVGREPIEDEHPLLRLENCIVTPHMAWATVEARQRLMSETAENIRRNMAGQPRNLVPPR